MDSFAISPSSELDQQTWVSIGPFNSAFRAAKMLESCDQYAHPICWSNEVSASFGSGTVLIHDVDMRVPVLPGNWRVAKLLNPFGELAGGIVYHEESVGKDLSDAARLIHAMENSGAPVICNEEPEGVRAQGIRFIGRYSWDQHVKPKNKKHQNSNNGVERDEPESQSAPWEDEDDNPEHEGLNSTVEDDDLWTVTQGPTCFFATSDCFVKEIQPFIDSRLKDLHSFADQRVADVLAQRATAKEEKEKKAEAGTGSEEEDPNTEEMNEKEIRETVLNDRDSDENRQFFLPPQKIYEHGGVGFTFTDDEYLFGRLWFTSPTIEKSSPTCKAFCFFTYCAPDYFGQMTLQSLGNDVQRIPICPQLPLVPEESARTYLKALMDLLLGISSDEELKAVLNGMTKPFLDALLDQGMEKETALIHRIFYSSILPLNEETFSKLFRKSMMLEQVNDEAMLALLTYVSDEVLQEAGHKEQLRFKMLHEGIVSGKLDVENLLDDYYRSLPLTMPSHLAFHIFDRPVIAKELIRRKFPVNSMLASMDMDGAWFRTVLAEAAFLADEEAVEMLLDAGADIEESIGGDPWNAIVYAVASGDEDVIDIFRSRFPKHPIWRSTSIPLKMKSLPRRDPWQSSEDKSNKSQNQEIVKLGSVDDLIALLAEEERRLQMEQLAANGSNGGFGGFGGGFGGGFSFATNF